MLSVPTIGVNFSKQIQHTIWDALDLNQLHFDGSEDSHKTRHTSRDIRVLAIEIQQGR